MARARSYPDQRIGQVRKRLRDRGEAEFPEQTLEPPERAAQPAVMPYPRQPGNPEARLLRIDLPGMDVERARRAAPRAIAQRRADEGVREQPEIRAAARRKVRAPAPQRGRRHFGDATHRPLQPVRVAVAVGIAVAWPAHGEQARVVAVALLDEDIERPLATWHDRKARSAEPEHRRAAQVLEHMLCAPYGIVEWCLTIRALGATRVPDVAGRGAVKTGGAHTTPCCGDATTDSVAAGTRAIGPTLRTARGSGMRRSQLRRPRGAVPATRAGRPVASRRYRSRVPTGPRRTGAGRASRPAACWRPAAGAGRRPQRQIPQGGVPEQRIEGR